MNTEFKDFLKAINPIQNVDGFDMFTKSCKSTGLTDVWGVKVFNNKVQRQWRFKRNWMWEMDNDGKRFCILPHKKWKFIW